MYTRGEYILEYRVGTRVYTRIFTRTLTRTLTRTREIFLAMYSYSIRTPIVLLLFIFINYFIIYFY